MKRGMANGRGFAVLGKTTRAVADHASKDVGDDIADSDRVDADAVLDGFERERAGQLVQCTLKRRWWETHSRTRIRPR